MYSDRPRGGRSGGGGFGGGGGGYRRDGGDFRGRDGGDYGDQGYQQRSGGGGGRGWGDRGSSGSAQQEIYVDQRHVGRIIGKGGTKIRDLQETSGANIKVNSREVEDGKVRICLSGSDEACSHAHDLINDITEYFNGQYGGDRGGGGGGRGGFGRRDGGSFEGGRRPQTCYRCGEEGHMARNCSEGY